MLDITMTAMIFAGDDDWWEAHSSKGESEMFEMAMMMKGEWMSGTVQG